MEIILILLLLIIIISVFILYKIILWISKKKTRVNWTLSLLGILILAKIINFIFFTEMELIQSKVYTDIFFLKNPRKAKDCINTVIKQFCLKKMNTEFIGNEKKFRYYNSDSSKVWIHYDLDFYNYTDNFFGSNTAYFIENEEDDGGPTSMHFLSEIQDEKIATFSIDFCENDTVNYYAKITYHQGYKIDTIFSKCPTLPKKIIPINEPDFYSTEPSGVGKIPRRE